MNTALVERESIREMEDRIAKLLPGGGQIPQPVRLSLAQLALKYGLDPFAGEIVAIPVQGGTYQPYVGLNGMRRAARTQERYQRVLVPLNDAWAQEYYKMAAEEVRKANGFQERDIVWLCAIHLNECERAFVELGVCGPSFEKRGTAPAFKMAMARAERAALRAAFDLPFAALEHDNGHGEDDVVDGEVTVTEPEPRPEDDYQQFLAHVCETIPYYSHPRHVENTIAKLGLEYAVETSGALLEVLNDYANGRADEDAAADGQGSLFDPEDESMPF